MEGFRYTKTAKKRPQPDSECQFEPKSRDDLVMHRTRVKDISNWIDDSIDICRACILLLSGPAGCGKMATVKVLAAEKDISVIEWISPMDSYKIWNGGGTDWSVPVTAASQFKDFLHRAGRYSSVIVEKSPGKKLILVKDFPPSLISAPDEFREILDYYVAHGTAPIVFMCTESVSKKSTDLAYELFTESFKQKHRIVHLTVNAVSITNMIRALRRVLQLMKQTSQSCEELVRQVADESHGDIRKAINTLRIKLSGDSKKSKVSFSSRGLKGRGKKKQDKAAVKKKKSGQNEDDDEDVGLFHSVGRVLYAKREMPSGDEPMIIDDKSDLKCFRPDPRGEYVHKPMEIVNQYSHYANQFINLAHGNYLDIFSSIDSISEAAEYLSYSDVVMAEWRAKDVLSTMGFSIAVLGLMEYNNDPVRRWRPLRGNQWTEDLRAAKVNHDKVKELFGDCCISKLDLYTDLIPSLSRLWHGKSRNRVGSVACKHGFLPHDGTAMLKMLRKMKLDMCRPKANNEDNNFDVDVNDEGRPDTPIHISDDSD